MYRAVHAFQTLDIETTPMAAPDLLSAAKAWKWPFPAIETMLVESAKIAYYSPHDWI